jgi:hypothetical protein
MLARRHEELILIEVLKPPPSMLPARGSYTEHRSAPGYLKTIADWVDVPGAPVRWRKRGVKQAALKWIEGSEGRRCRECVGSEWM